MKLVKFGELFHFLPKSKIKAGEGLEVGKYPFFKSGKDQTKRIDFAVFKGESLIIGDGGEANIVYYKGDFSASDHCYVIQPKSKNIYTRYVYFFIKSHLHVLEKGFKGAGLKNISKKYISNIKIPLPETLDDQIKIANLLTQVEELISKREESIKLLDELLKSTFLDMFGDPVLNPKGWEKRQLKQFGKIITGNTPSRSKNEYYDDNYIEWIKTDNIFENEMYVTQAKEYLSKLGMNKARVLKSNSLLVTCIAGSIKSIGTVALTNRKIAFNQQINAIEPSDKINPFFLYWMFKISKRYVQNQAGKGMKKIIIKSTFEKILFPLPPKPLQDIFATIVQQVEATKVHYQNSLDELNNLFSSLSQKAFRGELDLSKMEVPDSWTEKAVAKQETYEKALEKEVYESGLKHAKTVTFEKIPLDKLETYILDLIKLDAFDMEEMEHHFGIDFSYDEFKEKFYTLLKKGKIRQVFDTEYKKMRFEIVS